MKTNLMISKDKFNTYTDQNDEISFVRRHGGLVKYKYRICKIYDEDSQFVLIKYNPEVLSATNWVDTDVDLFRYYLNEEKFKKLPIYADINEDDVIFVTE